MDDQEHGPERTDAPVPPERWIVEPVFDSALYLGRRPVYEDELTERERAALRRPPDGERKIL